MSKSNATENDFISLQLNFHTADPTEYAKDNTHFKTKITIVGD